MTTFKCWLIANFEIVMFWIGSIIFGIIVVVLLLFFGNFDSRPPDEVEKAWFAGIGGIIGYILLSIVCTYPTKKGTFQFVRYFLMLGTGIFFTWIFAWEIHHPGQDYQIETMILPGIFWIVFAVASVIAILLAIYTYRNMNEVVSRRMLYRNSNVSLFEFAWLYTLDRFCNITVTIVYHGLWISFFLSIPLIEFTAEVTENPANKNGKAENSITTTSTFPKSQTSDITIKNPENNKEESTTEVTENPANKNEKVENSITTTSTFPKSQTSDITIKNPENNKEESTVTTDSDLQTSEYLLTENDLKGLSKAELRILRNEIYARHGYIFKSEDLREYFSQQPWYSPRYNDVSDKLTAVEKKNVEFIKQHE